MSFRRKKGGDGGPASEEEGEGLNLYTSKRLSVEVGALKDSKDELDMRAVTLLMWKARERPELIEALTQVLQERHSSKTLMDGVEFYLPQLLHMLVHLEVDWPADVLQEFVLMVCHVSMHFALKMFWILSTYMEDAQPELENQKRNPHANEGVFLRCSSLLYALERAVVYGENSEVQKLERDFQDGKLTKNELDLHLLELRRKNAHRLVEYENKDEAALEGELLYKRTHRSNPVASKGWKTRRFVIKNRILLCYRIKDGLLKRAVPLYGTEVKELQHRTYDYYFELHDPSNGRIFKLAAPNQKTRAAWIKHLRKAAKQPPLIKAADLAEAEISEKQSARHGFFHAELAFVRRLTDIAEELRHVERVERQATLKRRLLKLGKELDPSIGLYLPIQTSTAPFHGILDVDPNSGRVFSTKERCPILLTFKVEDSGSDVATTLHDRYGEGFEKTFGEVITERLFPSLAKSPSSVWGEEETFSISTSSLPISNLNIPSEEGLDRVLVKSNDDLRQEVFILQLFTFLQDIWAEEGLNLWLLPFNVLATGKRTGLVQVVQDAQSLDSLKADYQTKEKKKVSLLQHFRIKFEQDGDLAAAQRRFVESLAGYSMATYIFAIRDRHNGNIMLRDDGRLVHIDFGFVLGMAPGKDKVGHTNFSLERAPFKLTNEMVEVMGGTESDLYDFFVEQCVRAVLVAREHIETIENLIEITGFQSTLPAFNQPGGGVARVLKELRTRLFVDIPSSQVEDKVRALITKAKQHPGTVLYEKFQQASNGIQPIY